MSWAQHPEDFLRLQPFALRILLVLAEARRLDGLVADARGVLREV